MNDCEATNTLSLAVVVEVVLDGQVNLRLDPFEVFVVCGNRPAFFNASVFQCDGCPDRHVGIKNRDPLAFRLTLGEPMGDRCSFIVTCA